MEKSLVKFVFEQHNRLSCIIRYNNTPKISGESVAEHSYYVAFLSMLLADCAAEGGLVISKEKVLQMALVHDLEEIISGDIIRVFKTGGFREELDKMNEQSMKHLTGVLTEPFGNQYYASWKEAKDKQTPEAVVVDLADLCSTLMYCIREIHLGNKYFKEVLEYAIKLVLPFSRQIPELKAFIREFSEYCISYLLDDKKVAEDINKAVRVFYEYGQGDKN